MKLQHLIVTRYNLGLYGRAQYDHAKRLIDPAHWMAHRLELFRRYAYPSVIAQTRSDFVWLVLVDAKTPRTERRRLAASLADTRAVLWKVKSNNDAPSLVTSEWMVCDYRVALNKFRNKRADWLVTTRLDNDDALHERAIETIRDNVDPTKPIEFLDLPIGCYTGDGPTTLVDFSGPKYYWNGGAPFVSCVESVTADTLPQTALCVDHHRVGKRGPVREILTDEPMWLIVAHEHNLWNRGMPGKEVAALPEGFKVAK